MRQIRINGRKEFGGIVEAEAIVSPKPLEGFTNCDPNHGWTTERNHPLFKVPYEGKVLVYTTPRGSGGFMSYGPWKNAGRLCSLSGQSLECQLCYVRSYSGCDRSGNRSYDRD